ncbi:L,D-transpeptidase [Solirubrobacter soli]|uniref:L,D-transpeptidase n=1 Tax=Solirubrobacter soli TaxID=363832 RepID=UPI0004292717|nr:L,D-transpeptidase [Solirubrobacter soli]
MRLTVTALVLFLLIAGSASAACPAARPSDTQALRAELPGRTGVSARPGGKVRHWLSPSRAGALLVLAGAGDRDGRCWLQVRLPTRPNVAKGWIAADRVVTTETPWRIEVRLDERMVTLLRAGKVVRRYRAVIGAPATPTPQGLFAVVEAYKGRPSDFLGSWVLTITAHSDVLQHFDGGDGRVALHGRGGASLRDPLGSAASHGCVRLSNAAIAGIVRRIGVAALPGTPVEITPSG